MAHPQNPNQQHRLNGFAKMPASTRIEHIEVLGDYADDSAYAEVRKSLAWAFPDVETHTVSLPPFDTVTAGYVLYQLGFGGGTHPVDGTLFFHNVAPRDEIADARERNLGEEYWIGRIEGTEVYFAGPASGFTWSLLRDQPVDIRRVPIPEIPEDCDIPRNSQFRSRDYFPHMAARAITGHVARYASPFKEVKAFDELERVSTRDIKPYPKDAIAFVDGYGNIKLASGPLTYPGGEQVAPGTKVRVTLRAQRYDEHTGLKLVGQTDEVSHVATVTDASFGVKSGGLALSAGSSGTKVNGKFRPLRELFLRNGRADSLFELPRLPNGQVRAVATVSFQEVISLNGTETVGRTLISEPITQGHLETAAHRNGHSPAGVPSLVMNSAVVGHHSL